MIETAGKDAVLEEPKINLHEKASAAEDLEVNQKMGIDDDVSGVNDAIGVDDGDPIDDVDFSVDVETTVEDQTNTFGIREVASTSTNANLSTPTDEEVKRNGLRSQNNVEIKSMLNDTAVETEVMRDSNLVTKHIASNTQLMQELPLELEMKFRKEANAKKRRRFSEDQTVSIRYYN
ncbi:uncharacterized protein B0P05DRAFT_594432 [Gilbertella persicaria]|uniref:uncharacterized protein n=1 Tax=Gilbertella persicaria TaxID=101096 RepID=UPI002220F4ED|nr:uncharacterized protein B0P05DRAFT_594432 [Gilbertella persicaria]KAI8091169.1 hypothetical protein B0P05DRAFT_594432 [Gilbertella persicaria]